MSINTSGFNAKTFYAFAVDADIPTVIETIGPQYNGITEAFDAANNDGAVGVAFTLNSGDTVATNLFGIFDFAQLIESAREGHNGVVAWLVGNTNRSFKALYQAASVLAANGSIELPEPEPTKPTLTRIK